MDNTISVVVNKSNVWDARKLQITANLIEILDNSCLPTSTIYPKNVFAAIKGYFPEK